MDIRILDSLLEELNTLPKHLIDNQFVAAGGLISNMARELVNVKSEVLKQNEKIKQLEKQICDLLANAVDGESVEKGK